MAKESVTVKNHRVARYGGDFDEFPHQRLVTPYGKSLFYIWPSPVKYLVSLQQGKQIMAFSCTAGAKALINCCSYQTVSAVHNKAQRKEAKHNLKPKEKWFPQFSQTWHLSGVLVSAENFLIQDVIFFY